MEISRPRYFAWCASCPNLNATSSELHVHLPHTGGRNLQVPRGFENSVSVLLLEKLRWVCSSVEMA